MGKDRKRQQKKEIERATEQFFEKLKPKEPETEPDKEEKRRLQLLEERRRKEEERRRREAEKRAQELEEYEEVEERGRPRLQGPVKIRKKSRSASPIAKKLLL